MHTLARRRRTSATQLHAAGEINSSLDQTGDARDVAVHVAGVLKSDVGATVTVFMEPPKVAHRLHACYMGRIVARVSHRYSLDVSLIHTGWTTRSVVLYFSLL